MCSGIGSVLLICSCLLFNGAKGLQISTETSNQPQVVPSGHQLKPSTTLAIDENQSNGSTTTTTQIPPSSTSNKPDPIGGARAQLEPSAAALMAAVASLDDTPLPVSETPVSDNSSTTSKPSVSDQLVINVADQIKVNETQSPRSDKQQVLDMFGKFFTQARSHDDLQQKELVRDGVIIRLKELGFETSFLQKSRFEFRRRPAYSYNMISILPGRHRQTKRDRIVLIGAHWDSATKAPVSYINNTYIYSKS